MHASALALEALWIAISVVTLAIRAFDEGRRLIWPSPTKAVASFQNTVVSVAAAGVSVHRSTASAAGRSGGHEGLCSFQALHGSCQHLQCGKETEEPSLLAGNFIGARRRRARLSPLHPMQAYIAAASLGQEAEGH